MVDPNATQILIRDARGGDAAAFQRLVALYHPRLRARLQRQMTADMRAHVEPDDVLQQVYLEAFRSLNQFQYLGKDSFLRWLFTILDRKLIDEHRALHAERRDVRREVRAFVSPETASYVDLLARIGAKSATASQVLRTRETIGTLEQCLSELPEHYRDVIRMRFLQGRAVSEVARTLKRSEGSVHMICHRALQQLRERFESRGLMPES